MKLLFVIIALLYFPAVCLAKPIPGGRPRDRYMTGIIHTVSPQTKEITIHKIADSGARTLVWTDRTRLAAPGGPGDLQQGSQVRVHYRTPVFGRPFVTRITILPIQISATRHWFQCTDRAGKQTK